MVWAIPAVLGSIWMAAPEALPSEMLPKFCTEPPIEPPLEIARPTVAEVAVSVLLLMTEPTTVASLTAIAASGPEVTEPLLMMSPPTVTPPAEMPTLEEMIVPLLVIEPLTPWFGVPCIPCTRMPPPEVELIVAPVELVIEPLSFA